MATQDCKNAKKQFTVAMWDTGILFSDMDIQPVTCDALMLKLFATESFANVWPKHTILRDIYFCWADTVAIS